MISPWSTYTHTKREPLPSTLHPRYRPLYLSFFLHSVCPYHHHYSPLTRVDTSITFEQQITIKGLGWFVEMGEIFFKIKDCKLDLIPTRPSDPVSLPLSVSYHQLKFAITLIYQGSSKWRLNWKLLIKRVGGTHAIFIYLCSFYTFCPLRRRIFICFYLYLRNNRNFKLLYCTDCIISQFNMLKN